MYMDFGDTAFERMKIQPQIVSGGKRLGELQMIILILSIAIMLGVLAVCSKYSFKHKIESEMSSIHDKQTAEETKIISRRDLSGLPDPVVRWLESSGIINTPVPRMVLIRQTGRLRLKPEQKRWMHFRAHQVVGCISPSFSWCVETKLNPLFRIFGRDFFSDEKAALEMRLNSVFPVAKKEGCKYLHKSALQRFMMEMIWYPAFALDPRIEWEPINASKAKAILQCNSLRGEVVFEVDANGDLIKCFAERYYSSGSRPRKYCCVGAVLNTEILNDLRIPTEVEITWKLDEGNFNWFKCSVDSVTYL